MSAILDFQWYSETFMGSDADETTFPALYAHASRIIGAMTHWRVSEGNFTSLPSFAQTSYRLALCSQIDFLALNGIDSINEVSGSGFTVGKVTVHAKSGSTAGGSGAMSANISPASLLYLEQSGLMNPQVPVAGWFPC